MTEFFRRMLNRLRLICAWVTSLLYWVVGGAGFLLLCVLLPVFFAEERARAEANKRRREGEGE